MQETEAQRDKLVDMRKEFERAEDRYSQDIERLTERLQNVQFQYEKAKTEKEKSELQSLKLTRDLERTTLDLDELRAQRGIEENTNIEERKGNYKNANKILTNYLSSTKILLFSFMALFLGPEGQKIEIIGLRGFKKIVKLHPKAHIYSPLGSQLTNSYLLTKF